MNEGMGLVLLALGIALTCALVSYHPLDASWDTATAATIPMNLIGRVGAIAADALLQFAGVGSFTIPLLLVVLAWRRRGRFRRPTLVGVALEDLSTGVEGSLLDKQPDGSYVINGEVARAGPSSVVLVLRDRDVEIHLHDHENPVAVGDRARVRAQLVG